MIAHNPLHRSGRAALPHPAPALGDDAEAKNSNFSIDGIVQQTTILKGGTYHAARDDWSWKNGR